MSEANHQLNPDALPDLYEALCLVIQNNAVKESDLRVARDALAKARGDLKE